MGESRHLKQFNLFLRFNCCSWTRWRTVVIQGASETSKNSAIPTRLPMDLQSAQIKFWFETFTSERSISTVFTIALQRSTLSSTQKTHTMCTWTACTLGANWGTRLEFYFLSLKNEYSLIKEVMEYLPEKKRTQQTQILKMDKKISGFRNYLADSELVLAIVKCKISKLMI